MKPKRLLIETVKQTNGDLKMNALKLGKFLIKHSIHLTHI